MAANQISDQEAKDELWRRGILNWKLHAHQKPIYALIKQNKSLKFVLNCSRRIGKTTILCLIALEFCLQNADVQVRFAAPTMKALKKIIKPIVKKLVADCPDDIKPIWRAHDGFYYFPSTGAELHVSGCDNQNYENLRGQASNLNIIDEAGFVDELSYVLQDVLIPQTLTTGGQTILASTPPRTPAHDFYAIATEAEAQGNYAKRTIYENTSIDEATIKMYAKEAGGEKSSTFLREYLCEFTVDTESQIIPEWNDAFVEEPVKDQFYRFYHKYDAMDVGVRDLTVCLFAHYNFSNATLYVEDEFVINGPEMVTPKVHAGILAKEHFLWPGFSPYKRIADNTDPLLLQDLGKLHGMHFMPTAKDSLHAMINEVRLLVGEGRIRVSPKCKQLLGCLRYGIWTDDKKQFARSSVYGHFDALAALVYLVRNIDQHTNPIPLTYSATFDSHVERSARDTQTSQALRQLFKV